MKKIFIITLFLFLGCGCKETAVKTSTSEKDVIQKKINNEKIKSKDIITNDHNYADDTDKLPSTSRSSINVNFNAKERLEKLINDNDSRELVYLLPPSNNMIVYCYHAIRSECHIEGVHNNEYFSYDISQIEGQNKGKLTAPGNPIESAKTFPVQWITVNDEYAMVQMTSKIMKNSQQHTLHEPLVIYYKTGMMVR